MFFYSARPRLPVRILSVKTRHFNEKIFNQKEEFCRTERMDSPFLKRIFGKLDRSRESKSFGMGESS
ncbi:hypothetical protein EHQ67_17100 [Leptospira kmetyi]|nr:hypothetical protein EHQ67_17100 [Leptospira kmetyi]